MTKTYRAMLTAEDCLPVPSDMTGCIMVLRPSALGMRWQKPEFQLVKVTGGFGAKAGSLGTKVYGEHLADGDQATYRHGDFIGMAPPAPATLVVEILANKEGEDPLDPTDMVYLAVGGGAWGKGDTITEAKRQCKRSGATAQVVYYAHREAFVNEWGGISYSLKAPAPEKVWTSAALAKKLEAERRAQVA